MYSAFSGIFPFACQVLIFRVDAKRPLNSQTFTRDSQFAIDCSNDSEFGCSYLPSGHFI